MENLMEVKIPLNVEEDFTKVDKEEQEEMERREDETGAEEQ